MELIVFDLDGTLLDARSGLSAHTRQTLQLLSRRGIAYTVATGRTLHGARALLDGHGFALPHIYKNGVMIWHPQRDAFSHRNLLTLEEIRSVLEAFRVAAVAPFIFTLDDADRHAVYHAPGLNPAERKLAQLFRRDDALDVHLLAEMPAYVDISNISAIGSASAIDRVQELVADEPHLVAYGGEAIEGDGLHWLDIHHSAASKGGAVTQLKADLGVSRVICFGDSDNDLSMFEIADESYAPSNARAAVRDAATEVIGHHDADGISRFLRRRFEL
ncbi:MAG: haloacid dehalogenase [Halioglobus sp.]|nr:haloacid dehalogenase [Halioglobus sp.]|tara:strand:+ start:2143 stop:2964 length:822 start_codon:yes stop_codon:yes gene_type:complete